MLENHFEWCMKGIAEDENKFYSYMDKELADKLYEAVKAFYPNARMTEYEGMHYITLTKEGEKKLKEHFERMYIRYSEAAAGNYKMMKKISEWIKK